MPFNRTAWTALIDDDTSNTVGTLWTKTKISDVMAPVIQTTTLTGAQNNFALTADCRYLYCNNASLVTFTGFSAGYDGQLLQVVSMNAAGQVALTPQSGSSTAANRFLNFATVGNTMLAANSGTADFTYDATAARWRLTNHQQGAWISPAYAGTDYTSPTGTWVVGAGDVIAAAYLLSGRTLQIRVWVGSTDVTGTPVTLNRVIPGGYTAAGGDPAGLTRCNDAGASVAGLCQCAGTAMLFYSTTAGGGWTAGANRAIEVVKTIEVT